MDYISTIRAEAFRGRMCTKFGAAVGIAKIITTDKFWWLVEGCRFCRRSKIAISYWQDQSPLTLGCVYRAGRDYRIRKLP